MAAGCLTFIKSLQNKPPGMAFSLRFFHKSLNFAAVFPKPLTE
jgi:hypothetical protein